ncbi:HlyD family secretion protein [Aliivibrio fischeri]|uniref:HlyD family efflux transporter periplasmic adaptor subunit n=1 Tax=Aliivibrio fischeri SR5 TaxID=1088719 RepID=A0AAV3EPA4_ALIFS|nr:HlyD family secretion protein [Aliivibrio fischeri]EHN68588.1 hypothetical protein VFSR5_A0486 [Aliivibrio fischeri SR5]MCE7555999.1 HlyD family efflux transporter periplasmic adaptor subunit [Aliivibrio fischeri]MCE7562861.1 HlyD family efflux transporter periplasmic adaptor subunit [Aliivibrio fischeri]MCE7570934.1 HlyD family efflux transporter periplasmic adaptor subunit [Aliivibrio fischeri]MUJ25072.1 HlyD family efflux transporter periplasmic adaptor subunit [Aliivibrio fischeri]
MKVKFHLEKDKQPTSDNGMKIIYGSAKRGGYRFRWYCILALVLSPILIMAYVFFQQYILTLAPGIITTSPVVITAPQDSMVTAINVKEGNEISYGRNVLELNDPVLDSDIKFIKTELTNLNKRKSKVQHDLKSYLLAIRNAKDNLESIKKIKLNYDKFIKEGKVSQVDYANIIGMYNSAQNTLTSADIGYQKALLDSVQVELAGGIAQVVRSLNQELVTKLSQKKLLSIHSPYDGNIIEINTVVGQRIKKGDVLATIASKADPFVIAYLEPKFIEKAKEGSVVTVILPNRERLKGNVSLAIETTTKLPAQLAKPFEGPKSLLKVKVTLKNKITKEQWVEGMPVQVSF